MPREEEGPASTTLEQLAEELSGLTESLDELRAITGREAIELRMRIRGLERRIANLEGDRPKRSGKRASRGKKPKVNGTVKKKGQRAADTNP